MTVDVLVSLVALGVSEFPRRYMKMLTLLDASAIADAMQTHTDDPGERTGQRMLATEVTRQVTVDLSLRLEFLRVSTASTVFAAVKSHAVNPCGCCMR